MEFYGGKLVADRSALPGAIAFAVQDDVLMTDGEPALAGLAGSVLSRLSCIAVVAATPSLPFVQFLLQRARPDEERLEPRDTETRTFLHDIPLIRHDPDPERLAVKIAAALSSRKGVMVEGVGVVAAGAVTVEQAYINYSSVFHATFVKYLQDLLREGFRLPGEREALERFRHEWLLPLTADGLTFRPGPLKNEPEIMDEICRVGRYTVERGLVDSFFGNISCKSGEIIYISQTAASLDSLAGCIDPVPLDNSSTTGITASSELLAHRRIYEATGGRTILHGHPRFAVIMSMECDETECKVKDCWKDCPKVRYLEGVPVVAGEIGAGGLAKRVPPVMEESDRALVYGHGVFTMGYEDFAAPFGAMLLVEELCRRIYFERLERWG
jgi:ribulose-5-phosphate 4-epimerase/fuculose-1-phosphate aldolase